MPAAKGKESDMSDCPSVLDPFFRGSSSLRIERYRERATSLRAMAADFAAEWHDIFLRLADSYEELARCTEREERAPLDL